MNKCKYCGADGIIREVNGLFYVNCSSCNQHIKMDGDQWQYIGITKSGCEKVWNENNIPTRIYRKKRFI